MEKWDADIYFLQEMRSESELISMVNTMPNYSYVFDEESGNLGFALVYKNQYVTFNSKNELWADTPNNDDGDSDYANNASYQFADRPPMENYVTWSDGVKTINLYLIGIHYKCCGDDSYDANDTGDETTRRHHASLLLTDYILNNRANDNVIILGDFNNVGSQSITNPTLSPFTDQDNFESANSFRLTDLSILQGPASGLTIFYKNLFKFFALFSLIVGQELKDIDTKLSNLEFEQVQLPLEQLHSQYPENSDILLRLSITHHYLSESAIKEREDKKNALKAFQYIKQANEIDPDNPNILKWYVITLGKTVEEDTIRNQIEQSKNIQTIALKVIELLPNDEFCYSIMGQWHYKLADLGRASRRIASILFSEPPKGSFEEAQYFFEKSLQYNPDYIGTYYWLGKTYLKLDKKQKAVELFKIGVTLDRPFKREEKADRGMKRYLEKL